MDWRQYLAAAAAFPRYISQKVERHTSQHANYQPVKAEEDYELSDSQNDLPLRERAPPRADSQISSWSRRRIILTALGILALVLVATYPITQSDGHPQPALRQVDHKLHLLITSSNVPDVAVCRTELTAGISGYSTPHILNREMDGRGETESATDQIRITNDHLNGFDENRDTDLVILLDGAHQWFQLRPEVLMERYYKILRDADERLKKHAGKAASPEHRVVFTASNECAGHSLDELACFAPPANPFDEASTMRFPNTGMIIGPVKELRHLFNRLNGRAIARHGESMTQQTLLAEIFGEQEFRREFMRQGSWSSRQKKVDSVLRALGYSKSSVTDNVVGRQLLEHPENDDYEAGITIDYGHELGLSISRRADLKTVEWMRHNVDPTSLPEDIKRSRPPFWTSTAQLPMEKTWGDVALLTSTRTGSIPAIILVDPSQQGDGKGGLDWRSLWLHEHARKLWDAQNEVPRLPLMSVLEGNTEHTFWNQELRMDRDGANWLDGGWKPWKDHCEWNEHDEVILRKAEEGGS